jgi:hypothetical protein
MPTKKYKPEQIVTLLRQVEVAVANGKATSGRSFMTVSGRILRRRGRSQSPCVLLL